MTDKTFVSLPFFFLVSATAIYTREGAQRQRTINVIADIDTPQISKSVLAQLHLVAMRRIISENAVEPGDVQDIVINNICLLGQMSHEDFYREEPEKDQALLDQPA